MKELAQLTNSLRYDKRDFKIEKGFLFLKEEDYHNEVIGFEMEYAFHSTPEQCRELKSQIKGFPIDHFSDINSFVIHFIRNMNLFFLEAVKHETDPIGIELVFYPMSFAAAKKISGLINEIITFLLAIGYSPKKQNPGFHANINKPFILDGLHNFCTFAFENPDFINKICGREGSYQRKSDIFCLLADGFIETNVKEYFDTEIERFIQKVKDGETGMFLGMNGLPSPHGYRIENTWMATPESGEDFLVKSSFIFAMCYFSKGKEPNILTYIENNVASYTNLYVHLLKMDNNFVYSIF